MISVSLPRLFFPAFLTFISRQVCSSALTCAPDCDVSSFADGDDLLASASGDSTIRVWDLSRTVCPSLSALRLHLLALAESFVGTTRAHEEQADLVCHTRNFATLRGEWRQIEQFQCGAWVLNCLPLALQHPELKASLRGHFGSVKSVQFRPGSQQELASGARDGSILLWDIRSPTGIASTVQPTQFCDVSIHRHETLPSFCCALHTPAAI